MEDVEFYPCGLRHLEFGFVLDLDEMTETTLITLAEPVSLAMLSEMADAEFLKQIQWTAAADPALAKAALKGDLKAVWSALTITEFGLGPRADRKKVHDRRCTAAMSLWSQPSFEQSPAEAKLAGVWTEIAKRLDAGRLAAASHQTSKKNKTSAGGKNGYADKTAVKIPRKLSSALGAWLDSAAGQAPTAWELVMLADLLRQAGGSLPAKVGIPLWRRALTAAGDWATQAETEIVAGEAAELHAISAGELPWVLGVLFSHIRGAETLRERARRTLRKHLDDHTDTDGTLRAQEMERLTLWLPPLVRAAEWAYAAEVPLWGESGGERFQSLIQRVAACFAGDGHLSLDQTAGPHALPLLLTAARLAGGSKKDWPLKFLLDVAEASPELLAGPGSPKKHSAKLKTSRRRAAETDTDAIVQQSDWARVACLRNHAGRNADVFAITHQRPLPEIDLSILGHGLLRGTWGLKVSIDQTPIDMPAEWTCVCWHSDADGDYLELQYTINENRRIERQMFLSRSDHFLVIADCISGAGEAVIDYTARWPLVANANVARRESSRECIVSLGEVTMRTFPLALPDDVYQSPSGSWGLAKDAERPCLELRQTSVGGLYAPVVFDWTPARSGSYADWKTLTVTENGPKVKAGRASGHRLRLGNHQLLIYRSLAPTEELRTVLGHHTGHETIIARFDKSGDMKPLLIVE